MKVGFSAARALEGAGSPGAALRTALWGVHLRAPVAGLVAGRMGALLRGAELPWAWMAAGGFSPLDAFLAAETLQEGAGVLGAKDISMAGAAAQRAGFAGAGRIGAFAPDAGGFGRGISVSALMAQTGFARRNRETAFAAASAGGRGQAVGAGMAWATGQDAGLERVAQTRETRAVVATGALRAGDAGRGLDTGGLKTGGMMARTEFSQRKDVTAFAAGTARQAAGIEGETPRRRSAAASLTARGAVAVEAFRRRSMTGALDAGGFERGLDVDGLEGGRWATGTGFARRNGVTAFAAGTERDLPEARGRMVSATGAVAGLQRNEARFSKKGRAHYEQDLRAAGRIAGRLEMAAGRVRDGLRDGSTAARALGAGGGFGVVGVQVSPRDGAGERSTGRLGLANGWGMRGAFMGLASVRSGMDGVLGGSPLTKMFAVRLLHEGVAGRSLDRKMTGVHEGRRMQGGWPRELVGRPFATMERAAEGLGIWGRRGGDSEGYGQPAPVSSPQVLNRVSGNHFHIEQSVDEGSLADALGRLLLDEIESSGSFLR